MAGVILRNVFTISYRTRNPLVLFLLSLFGTIFLTPLVLAVITALQGSAFPFRGWVMVVLLGLLGLILLVNVIRNVFSSRQR